VLRKNAVFAASASRGRLAGSAHPHPWWLSVPIDHTEGYVACATGLLRFRAEVGPGAILATGAQAGQMNFQGVPFPTCTSTDFSDLAPLARPSIRPSSSAQAARLLMLPLLLVKAGRCAMALCFAAERISRVGLPRPSPSPPQKALGIAVQHTPPRPGRVSLSSGVEIIVDDGVLIDRGECGTVSSSCPPLWAVACPPIIYLQAHQKWSRFLSNDAL
jgi:hypothetical protein